jgi:hypothetical protein
VDGLLVRPFDSADRWAEVLTRLARDPQSLRALGQNVRPPRSSDMVADEMLSLYARLIRHERIVSRA